MNKLFNTHPLVVDKELARILGLNEALILQQVHYWLGINEKSKRNFHEGKYWTYNTIDEWQEEFPFWSTSTVKRVFKKLRDMNLIIVDNFNLYQMDRTLWYAINYEELERLVENHTKSNDDSIRSKENSHDTQNDQMDNPNMTPAIPEISTKISSEISNPSIYQSSVKSKEENKEEMDGLNHTQNKINSEKIIENCELYAIDENYKEAVAHAIRLLVLDVEKSQIVKIGDRFIPVKIIEKDLERLDFFVIEYAVSKFKEASERTHIRNPVEYLKVLIYNSINEINIDRDFKLRYYRMI